MTGRFDQSGRSLTARVIWSWVNAESGDAITLAYELGGNGGGNGGGIVGEVIWC